MNTPNYSSGLQTDSRQLFNGIMSAIALVVIGIMTFIPISHHLRLISLQKTGVAASARVKDLSVEQRTRRHSRGYSETFIATVTFFDKGKFVMGDVPVTMAGYESLHVGQQVPIVYLPSDPAYFRLAPLTDAEVAADVNLFVARIAIMMGLGIAAAMLAGGLASRRRLLSWR